MSIHTFFKSLTSTPPRRRPIRRLSAGFATAAWNSSKTVRLPSNFTAATGRRPDRGHQRRQPAGRVEHDHAGGADHVSLYVLTAVDNTTDGATGLPVIAANDNLTIIGNGDTIERSTAAGTPAFRLFDVAGGAALTLENLTLQGGRAYWLGGVGVGAGPSIALGSLTLNGVTVQGNTAEGQRRHDRRRRWLGRPGRRRRARGWAVRGRRHGHNHPVRSCPTIRLWAATAAMATASNNSASMAATAATGRRRGVCRRRRGHHDQRAPCPPIPPRAGAAVPAAGPAPITNRASGPTAARAAMAAPGAEAR